MNEADRQEYERCYQRWASMNAQVWQVPALAMTAQAFLFTVMLSSQTGWLPRLLCAFLAVLVSVLCIHAILKHRHHQSLDYGRMIELEDKWKVSNFSYSGWDSKKWRSDVQNLMPKGRKLQVYPWIGSSVIFWVIGFIMFGAMAVAVPVTAYLFPKTYEQPGSQPTHTVQLVLPSPTPSPKVSLPQTPRPAVSASVRATQTPKPRVGP